MSYSSDSFLKPIGTEKSIKFYDNSGNLTYTIKPTFITNVIDEINFLTINLKSGKEIKLDFINTNETILAKTKLLQQISTLLSTNDYVDNSETTIGYVTAPYSYSTFLRPIEDNDRNIKILGIDLLVKYTIDPFTINNTNITGNLLKINLKSNKVITLEFSTLNESKLAIIRLREQIDILNQKVPFLIDKNIENYISSKSLSGPTGPTGANGKDGIVGGQLYYFNESEAGYLQPYKQLGSQPIISTEEIVTKTLGPTESNKLISSYISDSLGLTVIPGGVQRFSLHYKKGASSSNISTYAVVQLANQNGQKYYDLGATQAIAYSNTQEISWVNDNIVNISLDIISITTEIQATDRIIISLYVNNLDSITQSVSFYTEGTNNYSYVQTSTAVVPGPQGPIGPQGPQGIQGATGIGVTSSFYLVETSNYAYDTTSDIYRTGSLNIGSGTATNGRFVVSSTTGSVSLVVDNTGSVYNRLKGITNTLFGYQSGLTTTSGLNNTSFGYQSLYVNTSGGSNTAIGQAVLRSNTTGLLNVGLGFQSLYENTSGGQNTGLGASSLLKNTTGGFNTAVGASTLLNNTTGANNTTVGYQSMYSNTIGANNTAVGYQSMYSSTSVVSTLTSLVGGTGYAPGTYSNVQLTYLSGSIALTYPIVDIFVGTGGTVSIVTLVTRGTGFRDITTVMSASFSTGSNFSVKVDTLSTGFSNTELGYQSLSTNTTGFQNTAIGNSSLRSNTTGVNNTAIGFNSLRSNTTGLLNVGLGFQSLYFNTTGYYNTAIGGSALFSNTTGYYNTALGYESLKLNTTGVNNTAVGLNSLYFNTTGYYNTAIGGSALYSNTTGFYNTAIGYSSLQSNTTGDSNTAVGEQSLQNNTTGFYNTTIGKDSMCSNTTGNYNTAVGRSSLRSNTTATQNTAVGEQSLYQNTTGFVNVAIGNNTLYSNITGLANVAIGASSLYNNTASYNTAIGYASLYSNTIGLQNIAIGYSSLYSNTTGYSNSALGDLSLFLNTTGFQNTAVGKDSLYNNTDGYQNTAIGVSSLLSNTTGRYNTAVGKDSLYNNTYGSYNTALGYNSLNLNTSGSFNIAIGYSSLFSNLGGEYNIALGINSGYLYQNNSNSVFIGYNSDAQADNQTNQIAIGFNTIGNGSNTVTLGNNDIIRTYLKGSVVIADGSQGTGKVLTSDADGLATWSYSSGGSGGGYYGTSSTTFTIPEVGFIRQVQTQTNLAFTPDQCVIVSSNSEYGPAEYYEGFVFPMFYALVDNYDKETGLLNLVSEYSMNAGLTFSEWFINLTGAIGAQGATGATGSGYYGTSSTTFTIPEVGYMREIETQINLGYTQDQWVLISSNSEFGEEEYYEEFDSPLFYAKVDDYNPTTGVLNVISEYAVLPGLTFSQWFINLSGKKGVDGVVGATGSVLLPYKVYTALLTQSGGSSYINPTSGTLIVGVSYNIDTYIAGDDFSNVGGPGLGNTGEWEGFWFIATGTTPNNWNNSSVLISNEGAPVVTVLENTIGNIWFTYYLPGQYYCNSSDLFILNKTTVNSEIYYGGSAGHDAMLGTYPDDFSLSSIRINSTYLAGAGSLDNDLLPFNGVRLEIRVYN